MRRTLQPVLAAIAGLSLLLPACSGESPTSPKPPDGGNSGGACSVTIALDATNVTPMAGTAIILRATVRKGGALVPDGTSVLFSTDFGFFLETGLPSVSKVTQNGFADVTLAATSGGLSKVKATSDCGAAEMSIQFQAVPSNGPFISSISPTSGSCAGGDTVTINGGRFGTSSANVQVLFGGKPATIQSFSDTKIVVLTPSRTLANPQVPEAVDVMIQFFTNNAATGSVTASRAFTFYCVDVNKRLALTSVKPNSGSPDGGQQVLITGNNFLPNAGSSAVTTRVTFGASPASVVSVTNTQITVLTPRHPLANPAVPETVDVSVTVDLGLVSQQSAVLTQAFTYRAGGGACSGAPGLFIATVQPEDPTNTGSPDGGNIVVITGGGFTAGGTSTTADRTNVFFGGVQGVTLSVTDTQVRVSTPRRVLASPDKPETVDVKLVVDAGGSNEACVIATGAYTYYPGGYLEPAITSLSPSSGPNDASTRVTIFGRNFKLPMQVFVGGIEAAVVDIKASQIIFLTPMATGPNSSLAGKAVDVVVRDTYSGKTATSPVQFRYYACPSVNSVIPSSSAWNVATVVTIAGQNFEEPVEVSFLSGGLLLRPTVTSVSSSLITIVMPVIDPRLGAGGTCANAVGALSISFPTLASCTVPDIPFTYRVDAMTAVSASPTQLNQTGGAFGTPIGGTPATITVTGSNFIDPMTVTLIKDGGEVPNTTVSSVVVANSSQLVFPAPAVQNSSLNTANCVPPGATSPTGTQYVPTSFGIRLKNARTGCTVDLPNVLIYNPADPSCRAVLTVTTTTLAAATICTAYVGATATASGGVTPYTWSATGLPTGMSISAAGLISGTPQLASAGVGGTTTSSVTLTVTDFAAATATRALSLQVVDPDGPFGITSPVSATFPNTGGTTGAFTATPSPTPAGFTPIAWSMTGGDPGITFSALTGQTVTINVAGTVPAATYNLQVTATDTPACGGPAHTRTVPYTIVKNP